MNGSPRPSTSIPRPERVTIAGSIEVPRMLNGLWQLATGHGPEVDVLSSAEAMQGLVELGLDGFDMADHYGPAELVIGAFHATSKWHITPFTKWCPPEGKDKTFDTAEAAVTKARTRMGLDCIPLMQYHCWDYTDDTYLYNLAHLRRLQRQGVITHIGLTNVDSAHLQLLLDSGLPIATNQVSCSVIDLRLIRGRMSTVCVEHGVGILAYGTLLGGFLSEKWLDVEEPRNMDHLNWSLRKYLRFIRAAGGWALFQMILKVLAGIATKHAVSIAAVATRWVLDVPAVSAVIVGCRLNSQSRQYAERNLQAFSFSLDDEDRAAITGAQAHLSDIPGDCGDEYRRIPFLTAAGDLSHHIKGKENNSIEDMISADTRVEYFSGSKWEPIAGYCRAVRIDNAIRISGTTATPPVGLSIDAQAVGGNSARSQTVAILDCISRAAKELGGHMRDIVRTRVMIRNVEDVQEVSEAHGWVFKCEGVHPSNTLTTAGLIGDEFLVEIEAEAVVGCGRSVITLR